MNSLHIFVLLNWLPIAAATNHYKQWLKTTQKFIIAQFCRSQAQNESHRLKLKWQQGCVLP